MQRNNMIVLSLISGSRETGLYCAGPSLDTVCATPSVGSTVGVVQSHRRHLRITLRRARVSNSCQYCGPGDQRWFGGR